LARRVLGGRDLYEFCFDRCNPILGRGQGGLSRRELTTLLLELVPDPTYLRFQGFGRGRVSCLHIQQHSLRCRQLRSDYGELGLCIIPRSLRRRSRRFGRLSSFSVIHHPRGNLHDFFVDCLNHLGVTRCSLSLRRRHLLRRSLLIRAHLGSGRHAPPRQRAPNHSPSFTSYTSTNFVISCILSSLCILSFLCILSSPCISPISSH